MIYDQIYNTLRLDFKSKTEFKMDSHYFCILFTFPIIFLVPPLSSLEIVVVSSFV